MERRYVSIWFSSLCTDWFMRRQPYLRNVPFVLSSTERGRAIVKGANNMARGKGVNIGMAVADSRAILPSLQVIDDTPGLNEKLLTAIGEWCIRYTPVVAVDLPDGIILNASGCAHLWGGEERYVADILEKFRKLGYDVRICMADTIGTAWAVARYGRPAYSIIKGGEQLSALLHLPPSALRIEISIAERLEKLGLYQVKDFIRMPRGALRRRFGQSLLQRIDQALGQEIETIEPINPVVPYQERLPSLEPIRTATGIEIALKQLLERLCARMAKDEIGLRSCLLCCYRIDGNVQKIEIGTNRPSRNAAHLFKLFELKIPAIEPALGFELFLLEARETERVSPEQEAIWNRKEDGNDVAIAELLDRIAGKVGKQAIRRYLPAEHYWPERAMKLASSVQERPATQWRDEAPRPLHLLHNPERIEVTVPIPDYPPMLFHYKGLLHKVTKADGPERIEQEWWLTGGMYRDYYCVEDENGARYWLFRLGHYDSGEPQWYIHGFFG